ncbi:MAG: hypothetical protein J7L19_00150 [Dehalococcoidia bacterium]|nr:hypothetical protein [Dehalococcoidia bacterium]
MRNEIRRLAEQYQFFHWYLAFPDVFRTADNTEEAGNKQTGWVGEFDVVLGNPPWERVNLEDRQFFADIRPDIAGMQTSRRKIKIKELAETDPQLYNDYQEAQRSTSAIIAFCHSSGMYPHLNQARLNTYILFTELNASICSNDGNCGMIVPSGIATNNVSCVLFNHIFNAHRLASLYDFENREGIFGSVHRSYRFCLLTISGHGYVRETTDFVFLAHKIDDLSEASRHFGLSTDDLQLLSPITGLCPAFRSKRDRDIILQIYRSAMPFIIQKENKTDWTKSDFLIMFRSESSSHLYRTPEELEADYPISFGSQNLIVRGDCYLPIWEAKLMHQFDHRYATYGGVNPEDRVDGKPREVSSIEKLHA